MCIDIMEVWFGVANGQISSNFYTELSAHDTLLAGYIIVSHFYLVFNSVGTQISLHTHKNNNHLNIK